MAFFDRFAESLGLDNFDKRHKKAFLGIFVVAILVIVMWVMQMRKNIIYPLYGGVDPKVLQEQAAARNQTQVTEEETAMRGRDTDTDGISDWDELNVYKTSPYLADSDSDTFSDKSEIDSGNDPNCPKGKNCFLSSDQTNQGNDSLSSGEILNNSLQAPSSVASPSVSGGLSAEQKKAIRDTLGDKINDAPTIRALLTELGMDQATLDSLSDQQIIDTLNAMIK